MLSRQDAADEPATPSRPVTAYALGSDLIGQSGARLLVAIDPSNMPAGPDTYQTNRIGITMADPAFDRISFEILRHLRKDGWIGNKQLAAVVGLAPSTCHERVRKLRQAGIIRGAHIDIDWKSLGLALESVILIKLARFERSAVESFLDELTAMPEVLRTLLVNGRYDVLAHVAVRDTDHLREFGFTCLTGHPMVVTIETAIVFDRREEYDLERGG